MLDQKALSRISNDDLRRWHFVISELSKRAGIMSEVQSKIKEDLETELRTRGTLDKVSSIAFLKSKT
jgi:hypothetical protein